MKVVILCLFSLIVASHAGPVEQPGINWSNVFHMTNFHPKAPIDIFLEHKDLTPRIVGGDEAKPHQFPFQVAVLADVIIGTAFCGGSLISKKYVMTAAHCADGAVKFQIILGSHHSKPDPDSIVLQTRKVVIHPNWNSREVINDIAIIELPEEVQLNEKIQTVNLPSKSMASNTFAGVTGTVSGWGRTSDSASGVSPVLRFTTSTVLTNQDCSDQMVNLPIPSTQICLSGKEKKGTCNGDSGGPMLVQVDGKQIQMGITSYGLIYGCEAGYATAFTRVSSFLDFIAENTDVKINP